MALPTMDESCILNRRCRTGPWLLLPGPMEGVTAGSWVEVLTRHRWVRAWWTPFLRISTGVPRRSRLSAWIAPYLSTGLPVIAQIMGSDTARLAETAVRLAALGAAAIDLNCACPSREVVSSHAGGWHLQHPEWIGQMLLAMRRSCPGTPISVKLRSGWDRPDFDERLSPILNDVRPDLVTVHFRTVAEGYRAIGDGLDRLKRIRESLPQLTVLGSGDLFTIDAIRQMLDHTGVDGAAPARGMLHNPRLLADFADSGRRPPPFSPAEQHAFLREIASCGGSHGFVLQLAANFFGTRSEQFRALLDHRL